jgi:hypothetical protein
MTNTSDKVKDNQDLLKKEYEIIQSKIDKIGESKLKIRGWSITVLSAAIAGLLNKDMNILFWLISALIPISFHYLEYEQELLSISLYARAKNIEYFFYQLQQNDNSRRSNIQLNKADKDLKSTPRLAAVLLKAKPKEINYILLLKIENNLFFYFQVVLIILLYICKNYEIMGVK